MTCDERLEQLLNRAGQTFDESRDYTQNETESAMTMPILELVMKYLQCVRLIDCMEWALENVCGERDYLAYRLRRHMDCQSCGWIETCDKTPDHCKGWYFKMPEEMSADDA